MRLEEPIAVGPEQRRVETERLEQSISRLRTLLANRDFTSKAPAAVVERERDRLRELEGELRQLGG